MELTGPSGTRDYINIVNLSHPSPPSVEANTDVIHNQRQKTLKVSSDCYITRHFAYTVYVALLIEHREPVVLKNPSKCMIW